MSTHTRKKFMEIHIYIREIFEKFFFFSYVVRNRTYGSLGWNFWNAILIKWSSVMFSDFLICEKLIVHTFNFVYVKKIIDITLLRFIKMTFQKVHLRLRLIILIYYILLLIILLINNNCSSFWRATQTVFDLKFRDRFDSLYTTNFVYKNKIDPATDNSDKTPELLMFPTKVSIWFQTIELSIFPRRRSDKETRGATKNARRRSALLM